MEKAALLKNRDTVAPTVVPDHHPGHVGETATAGSICKVTDSAFMAGIGGAPLAIYVFWLYGGYPILDAFVWKRLPVDKI